MRDSNRRGLKSAPKAIHFIVSLFPCYESFSSAETYSNQSKRKSQNKFHCCSKTRKKYFQFIFNAANF